MVICSANPLALPLPLPLPLPLALTGVGDGDLQRVGPQPHGRVVVAQWRWRAQQRVDSRTVEGLQSRLVSGHVEEQHKHGAAHDAG